MLIQRARLGRRAKQRRAQYRSEQQQVQPADDQIPRQFVVLKQPLPQEPVSLVQ